MYVRSARASAEALFSIRSKIESKMLGIFAAVYRWNSHCDSLVLFPFARSEASRQMVNIRSSYILDSRRTYLRIIHVNGVAFAYRNS